MYLTRFGLKHIFIVSLINCLRLIEKRRAMHVSESNLGGALGLLSE